MVQTKGLKRVASKSRYGFGAILAMALYAAAPAWADLPAVQHYDGVEYVTGGFGLDESTAIKSAMADYPLVFTFSASDGQRAAYVSRVQLVVRNDHDATVLNVESQGPFLLARIAPGNYQVHATYRNQTQSREVTVSDTKSTRVDFQWDREVTETLEPDTAQDTDSPREFTPGSVPGLD